MSTPHIPNVFGGSNGGLVSISFSAQKKTTTTTDAKKAVATVFVLNALLDVIEKHMDDPNFLRSLAKALQDIANAKKGDLDNGSYLDELSSIVGASMAAALLSFVKLTNVGQDLMGIIAKYVEELADDNEKEAQKEQAALKNLIETKFDPINNKGDPTQKDSDLLSQYNNEYSALKAKFDAILQKMSTQTQAMTNIQSNGQENVKILPQCMSSIIDVLSFTAQAMQRL